MKESMSLEEIAEMLQTGTMSDPNRITITYLEGKPMWWLAEIIETKTNNSKEDVYNVLANEEYIRIMSESSHCIMSSGLGNFIETLKSIKDVREKYKVTSSQMKNIKMGDKYLKDWIFKYHSK